MSPDRLVYMANQIGKFFEYQKKDEVVPGIAKYQEVLGSTDAPGDLHLYRRRRGRARSAGARGNPSFEGALRQEGTLNRDELSGNLSPSPSAGADEMLRNPLG